MKRIAIYGKGGSGKSTTAAALSITFARRGMKVLHVGCDPKADSTINLSGGERIPTLLDLLAQGNLRPTPDQFIYPGREGIDLVEAGGPEPGAGCGGRGVARMFELFDAIDLFHTTNYDMVVFDVLGDVVCGGFAAPLRYGFAQRAFVVVSQEPLSLYAANNIVKALVTYGGGGVRLGGLIENASEPGESSDRPRLLAGALQTSVVGTVPRDPAIQEAEFQYLTAAELPEVSRTRSAIEGLADAILGTFDTECPIPVPLETRPLFELLSPGKRAPQRPVAGKVSLPEPRRSAPLVTGAPGTWTDVEVAERLKVAGGLAGGAEARGRVARLLGLQGGKVAALQLEVTDLRYAESQVRITLEGPLLSPLVIELAEAGPEVRSYATAGSLAVSHATPLNRGSQRVLDYAVKRLSRHALSLWDFGRLLLADGESAAVQSKTEAANAVRKTVGPSPRNWSVWGEEGTRGTFFFDQERRRLVMGEVQLADPMAVIHHAGMACQFSEQATTPYSTHFVRYPWGPDDVLLEDINHEISLFTNLNDAQYIAGSNETLHEAFAALAEFPQLESVRLEVSCPPIIAGEDYKGAVREFQKHFAGTVLAVATELDDIVEEIINQGKPLLAASPCRPQGEGLRVNLVGFPATRMRQPLERMLGILGVTVNQWQMPGISMTRLKSYGNAHLQVLYPQSEYARVYDDLFASSDVPLVRPPAPYGLAGTRAFFEALGEALALPHEEIESLLRAEEEAVAEELAALRAEARGIRLGLAVTTSQEGLLDDPSRLCGVPVVAFLEESGFAVERLTRSEETGRLEWWLGSGLHAVYSDLGHDRRLLGLGLGHFGLADFRPFARGAVETARRLVTLSRTPFLREYARFVGREEEA